MANDLTDLKITEVSFCKRGMNQHAKISLFKSADKKAGSSGDQPDGEKMSDTENKKVADLEKSVADLTARLEKADAEAKVAKAVAGLSDVEKAHYEGLDEKAQGDFLAKSADDRKAVVEKIAKADESVELAGQTIRKSEVGAGTFAVLKSQAEEIKKANERIAKAEEAAEMADLRKSAADNYGKIVGTDDDKAKLLKALKAVGGEVEAYGLKVLKAANETQAFETIGKKSAETVDLVKKREDKIAEIAKRDNIPTHQAMAKVAVENPELFNQE